MTFRQSSWQICFVAAALGLGGLLVCDAQTGGKQPPRRIEFSLPRGQEVSTNLLQSIGKPDGLKQLEEESFKPLQSFAPQSSLDGVPAPPFRSQAAPPITSKRLKELLERRKNWVFMNPQDLVTAPTIEDILKTPALGNETQDQKEHPSLDRYYGLLPTKRPAAKDPSQSKNDDWFGPATQSSLREEIMVPDDSKLPSNLRESAEALKRLFEPGGSDNPFTQGPTHGNLTDMFGFGNKTLSKEQVIERKKYLDDYRSVLDPSWHPATATVPGGSPFEIAPASPAINVKPVAGLPSVPSPAASSVFQSQDDILHPRLGPPELADVNLEAVGQTKATPVMPKIESTRVIPVTPSFDAPKRSFR